STGPGRCPCSARRRSAPSWSSARCTCCSSTSRTSRRPRPSWGVPADMAPGPDPAVLLVHGFASSAEHNWRPPGWLDLLGEAGRETIAVDLLGHGGAPRPASPEGYDAVEEHVAAA